MVWLVSDIAASNVGGVIAFLPTNILLEDFLHRITEAEVRSLTCACTATTEKRREDTIPSSFCYGACLPMHHRPCMAVSSAAGAGEGMPFCCLVRHFLWCSAAWE